MEFFGGRDQLSVERHTQNLSGVSMMNVLKIVLPDDILIITYL